MAALDAAELLALYAAGEGTPLQVLQGVTERVARRNPEINAFATMNPAALHAARESMLRWRAGQARALEGVPVTVSDLVDVAGLPTRRGSKTTDLTPARRDAPLVAVLRAAGAVILGKTNVSEFGWKYQGDNPLFGITRNPWNPLHTAGGPSGGAAAAAAAFFAPLHIADGDVCVAAAWNGVVGLKWGTMRETQGIIARSVTDVALLSAVLKGGLRPDGLEDNVRGLKIGILRRPGFAAAASEASWKAVALASEMLAGQGAELSEMMPDLPAIDRIFSDLWGARCNRDLMALSTDQYALLDPGLQALAARFKAEPPGAESSVREADCAQVAQVMSSLPVDILLCPTMSRSAPLAGGTISDPLTALAQEWAPWTMLFSLTGQPALTLPMGVDEEGLPTAVQIAARSGQEDVALRVARAVERALG